MGRTKRLRQRKRNDVTSNKYSPAIHLYDYLVRFGWTNHSKIICHDFPTTGRGVCSKIGLSTGDVLIKLPVEAMITLKTIESDKDFRSNTEECRLYTNAIPFQSLLAFYILYRNHVGDNDSPIKLYLNTLPKAFSTPYFCRGNELHYLPESILQRTVEQNKKIRDSFSVLQNAFGSKICKCCGRSYMLEIFTLTDFKWAYFAVNSRSVFLGENIIKSVMHGESYYKQILSDEADMALTPLLDMFNHSDTASTQPQMVNEGSDLSFQLITHGSYEPYEQIFISYGNLTNFSLLTDYGFSLERNVHDYFEISLVDIEALIRSERSLKGIFIHSNKFKFIRDHNLDDQMFIHAVDGLSHNLQVTLYLLFKEASHFTNVLNQTAFGSSVVFADFINREGELLTQYKIKEYQSFIDGFSKLKDLSISAQSAVQYMKHSILYLHSYLDKFF